MKSRANHFIDHGHNCQLTLPLALMILVDHKLKTNAIKTQHIHTYKAKQTDDDGRTWSNNTKRVKLCHNSNQYAREKETKKNLYIYCIFIEMQKTKWKRDSSFQFWPKEMQLRLVQLRSFLGWLQPRPALNLALILAWVFFFFFAYVWGLRFWVLVSVVAVAVVAFNCFVPGFDFGELSLLWRSY